MKILKESNASIGNEDINYIITKLVYVPIVKYLQSKYKDKLTIFSERESGIPVIIIAPQKGSWDENVLQLSIRTSNDWHQSYTYTLYDEFATNANEQEKDYTTLAGVCIALNTRFGL